MRASEGDRAVEETTRPRLSMGPMFTYAPDGGLAVLGGHLHEDVQVRLDGGVCVYAWTGRDGTGRKRRDSHQSAKGCAPWLLRQQRERAVVLTCRPFLPVSTMCGSAATRQMMGPAVWVCMAEEDGAGLCV